MGQIFQTEFTPILIIDFKYLLKKMSTKIIIFVHIVLTHIILCGIKSLLLLVRRPELVKL